MEASQPRRLKDVEADLARFRRMRADLAPEHHALKDVLSRRAEPGGDGS
jgi:putative transposase